MTPTLDMQADATRVNELMEAVIRRAPEQYLWGYNRYKGVPAVIQSEEMN
jgi:lauroyl/myristoyl acyltransferase